MVSKRRSAVWKLNRCVKELYLVRIPRRLSSPLIIKICSAHISTLLGAQGPSKTSNQARCAQCCGMDYSRLAYHCTMYYRLAPRLLQFSRPRLPTF